jgi:glycosyltransferase involved in cell wall biosynthesis
VHRVSIILPTYNGEKYLRQSVDSCMSQTYADFELIAVVDGSTDRSLDILQSYADERIRIHATENQGLPQALNEGFSLAQGEYWSWTSDDNVYAPDAFRTMVDFLDTHQATPMVCADCTTINGAGRPIGYNDTTWACFLYRADAAKQVGPYRPEFRLVEDVDFFVRLQHMCGRIERIRKPLYYYRHHSGSLSERQIAERLVVSLRLNLDLLKRGVVQGLSVEKLFLDRLNRAALARNRQAMEAIVGVAKEMNVACIDKVVARNRDLNSPFWWTANRLAYAILGMRRRMASATRLLISGGRRNG